MENHSTNSGTQEEQLPRFRGLYRHVKISVKALDRIIVACIAVILIVVALELRDPGYTITFDSKGGTDVAAQTDLMYGDHVTEPEPPTREGYTFAGWYLDVNYEYPFDFDDTIVDASATLYARWEPKTE